MEKIISTPRGYISHLKNICGLDLSDKNTNVLLCNWPFAFGFIPVPDVNENIFIDSFNWSIKNGFIEEDASIHAAMYSYGFCKKKNIIDSLLYPSQVPELTDLITKKFLTLPVNELEKKLSNCCTAFSFPTAKKYTNGVYPIVDTLELLHQMFDVGAKIIQLRVKKNQEKKIDQLIKKSCELSFKYPGSKLFINDHWQLAIDNGAFGVHLGQEDLFEADMKAINNSGLHLGLSSHSYWEVSRAIRYKPSYIACGPIFPTKVKKMPWVTQGVKNLKYWARVLDFPIVAIGGINLSNLHKVKKSNCTGVSIISGIVNNDDPKKSFKILESTWKNL